MAADPLGRLEGRKLLPSSGLGDELLCAALLSYLVVALMVTNDWTDVLSHTFTPRIQMDKTYLALLVGVLGTTISPYLFFWQSAHRLEEMRTLPEEEVR